MFLASCADSVVHVNNPKSNLSKTRVDKQSPCLDLADFQAAEVAVKAWVLYWPRLMYDAKTAAAHETWHRRTSQLLESLLLSHASFRLLKLKT